jgi:hypothetical protein
MLTMLVVQPAIDEIVNMVAMRDRLMATTLVMDMVLAVAAGPASLVASVRIYIGDLDHMLVDVILMRVVQTTVMQIVDMVLMLHRRMAAIRPMNMRMRAAGLVARHFNLLCLDASTTSS